MFELIRVFTVIAYVNESDHNSSDLHKVLLKKM